MFKLPNLPRPVSHQRAASVLRVLTMDAVEAAKSGHPGMPMGMADIAEVLWNHFLVHDPNHPLWPNRDRFVLSNGHGSMLLYALLHLAGYPLSLDELRRFRRLHSLTPGHPEYGVTPGVETSTGPLGQGLANAVGMALAERLLAAEFNRPGHEIVNHRTWVFVGDGCLMEGISQEAISLAGTLGLDRLIVCYDDNRISIDGQTDGWFRDDTPARFEACGWRVIRDVDGHDPEPLFRAMLAAKGGDGRPTLISCRTVIGRGAPNKQGTAAAHGAPLGAEEVARVRAALDWPDPPFVIPADVTEHWDARRRGYEAYFEWEQRFYAYEKAYPDSAREFTRRMAGELPARWPSLFQQVLALQRENHTPAATRKSSESVLDACAPQLPELFGGSADLTESNLTLWKGAPRVLPGRLSGRYLSWGVREFGMAAAMNGMALHGGLIPYGGTFAVFSDYARNAIRMAALMRLRVIYVFTHDSIGLGEDGPTHQPVEHAASLRLIPHLDVWRPCDGVETAVAWDSALRRKDGPTALLLSRQALNPMRRDAQQEADIGRGGYVLAESSLPLRVVLIATGSEVAVAMQAQTLLAEAGIGARVVSMPSTSVFDRQHGAWRHGVLPPGIPRIAVEAGHPDFWRKYVGLEGTVIGLSDFGESAPGPALFEHFGITAAQIAQAASSRWGHDVGVPGEAPADRAPRLLQCCGANPCDRRCADGAAVAGRTSSPHPRSGPAMFDVILFDLDGTLIDTAPEIGEALNLCLEQLGFPRVDAPKVRSWIGLGTHNLVSEALADRQGPGGTIKIETVLPLFARNYRSLIGTRSRTYPGVHETLAALHARGVPMAVISNKETEFARRLLQMHRIDHAFSVKVFGDTLEAKKPSALTVRHCMQKLMSIPPRTLLVGDSEIDVQTARNSDIPIWAVSYGYRKAAHARELGADRVLDSVVDVLPYLRSRRPIWADRAHAGAE